MEDRMYQQRSGEEDMKMWLIKKQVGCPQGRFSLLAGKANWQEEKIRLLEKTENCHCKFF